MFTGFQICSDLRPKQKCFRLREYDEGIFKDIFHEHIPKHRISEDNAFVFMKMLVVKYSSLGDFEILRSYMNSIGKEPSAIQLGRWQVEYPEPGVLRRYFDAGNIHAWYDKVVDESCFRGGKGYKF
jgi:hypothetical protein